MAALAGERTLVVKDDYPIASELKKQLMVAQADVVGPVACHGAARRLADTRLLDAAIFDIDLDGETSFMLADRLTAKRIPHLFATGDDNSSLPEAYRATPRLTEPDVEAVTIATVSALCGQGDKE